MAERGDDELDLILSNLDAGLRLVNYLIERSDPGELAAQVAGVGFLLEALIGQSALARDAYNRLEALAAAQAGHHNAA